MIVPVAQVLVCQVHRGQSVLESGLQTPISFLCWIFSLFLCYIDPNKDYYSKINKINISLIITIFQAKEIQEKYRHYLQLHLYFLNIL